MWNESGLVFDGPLRVDLRAKRVAASGEVVVRGRLEGTLRRECRRCLEPLSTEVDEDLTLVYAPEEDLSDEGGEVRPMPRGNDILIPPHGFQALQGVHVLEENTLVSSFRPHMHTRGKEMSVEAIYPDGHREVIGKVDDYKHIWQLGYEFEEDAKPLLPKGTVLLFSAVFDNTTDNPLNPDPNQWVVFGRRGPDEMSHMWLNITYLSDEQFEEIRRRRASLPIAEALR
jgi:hypothetical protein